MTFEIGNIVKTLLEPFRVGGAGSNQFINKLAGVVKTLSMSEMNENSGRITKTFPISCDISYAECTSNSSYKDLIPNSALGCMVYLEEESGVEKIGQVRGVNQYKVSYRVIGWVNQKKLGTNACSITGSIVNTIIGAIEIKPFNSGIYQTLQINVLGQDPKSYNPFGKYTYDQDATQYLMAPYDYFSVRIEITFNVNSACIEPFTKSTPIIC